MLIFVISSLTGCWDQKELNELGIVMALGFDRDNQTGKILLTSQIVRPGSLKSQQGGNKESPYEIVVTSGSTVFEAIRNTAKEFDRRSFFSHVKVIVVNETVARDGINDIMDFVSRTHEIRKLTWLVVTRGDEARKVLGIKHGIESLQANYMQGIIQRQNINSEVTSSEVIDFIKKMPGEGINPVTGVFNISSVKSVPAGGKEPEITEGLTLLGTAAYKKDKLVGFLNNEETRGFNFVIGKAKSGVIHIPSLQDEKENISIEIKKVNSRIKPDITDRKLTFSIEVYVEGNITEVGDTTDVSEQVQLERVNSKFSEFVNHNVNLSMEKIQKELKTDIVGFGSAFEEKYPREWKETKDQWDTVFPNVSYNLKVKTNLMRTGLLIKPIKNKKIDHKAG